MAIIFEPRCQRIEAFGDPEMAAKLRAAIGPAERGEMRPIEAARIVGEIEERMGAYYGVLQPATSIIRSAHSLARDIHTECVRHHR